MGVSKFYVAEYAESFATGIGTTNDSPPSFTRINFEVADASGRELSLSLSPALVITTFDVHV